MYAIRSYYGPGKGGTNPMESGTCRFTITAGGGPMSAAVTIPVWLFVLLALLAACALLERMLIPSVRWFFRRRNNFV